MRKNVERSTHHEHKTLFMRSSFDFREIALPEETYFLRFRAKIK